MKDDDDLVQAKQIADFASYEELLDSKVTEVDLQYLEDRNMARKLVELGYRGDREGYSKEQFLHIKEAFLKSKRISQRGEYHVLSAGIDYTEAGENNNFLRMLQQREEANRTGRQASVIMIRDYDRTGQEISGYIDYAHRLATEDWEPIFKGEVRLLPRRGDLSYMEWEKFKIYHRDSPNYEVVTNAPKYGMQFRNKRDNKMMRVDPSLRNHGENTSRTVVSTDIYVSVIIYDHYNR